MTKIVWLEEGQPFPPTSMALSDPNGLLAAGGDLSVDRLVSAYRQGIFPWYDQGETILWWSPSPRTVFIPDEIHCSKSLKKLMRRVDWQVRIDSAFVDVMEACAKQRRDGSGTWISNEIISAYHGLHQLGYAHSVEVYANGDLIGGLYGVALGKIFFGESMFSTRANASKFALIVFSRWLEQQKFALMDCQVSNPHLQSLNAQEIGRREFEQILSLNTSRALIDSTQLLWQTAAKKTLSCEGLILP